ncbi:MAG: undecaprenyldiphospho-muramoylpentapeptide beta-N-acetylglucosaminyltransferase [Lachnospiraceae bacterium]|nr:undecaprenyldiphospho-muramoylpentapeptide beta-N-acetylglucosaminyltransferase [Lachnospiraceae bacterium]
MSKKIILTGGGTAGHVTPNMALIPELKKKGYEIKYVGSYTGIEKKLIEEMGVEYQGISSGKLRRYFSMKNFSDPFRVLKGFKEAKKIMKDYNPSIVFSKGGFVSVPVVLAAKKYKIPVIIHESDMTPGLANRIAMKGASVICHNFPETAASLPDGKAVLTGSPIREELRHGDKAAGLKSLDFTPDKPVIMVMGGSLGAVAVNNAIRGALDELLDKYQIIHLCGKGKLDESLKNIPGYKQFEYVKSELTNYFAAADLLVSRAGANAICEIAALQKPNILIPLSRKASRGDQILNANSFKKQGFSEVIEEEDVTKESLVNMINQVYDNREKYIDAMAKSNNNDAITTILDLIEKNAK